MAPLDGQEVTRQASVPNAQKNWTIAKPKPISDTAVRCSAIMVFSRARRVRNHEKWLSAVTLTSNLFGLTDRVCHACLLGWLFIIASPRHLLVIPVASWR